MKKVLLIIAVLFSIVVSAQTKLSTRQADVISELQKGNRLYRTMIGYELVVKYVDEGQVIYDNIWLYKTTFKSLIKIKLIQRKSSDPKSEDYAEYILTDAGKKIKIPKP